MLQSLKHQQEMISLEAMSGENALSKALMRLPGFFKDAREYITSHIGNPLAHIFAKKDLQWTALKINDTSYTQIKDESVPVPPGLKTDYLSYSTTLLQSSIGANEILTRTVLEFERWISKKLGNPSTLASLSQSLPSHLTMDFETTEKLYTKISQHFVASNQIQHASVKYEQAFRRNADWIHLLENVDKINKYFTTENHDALKRHVSNIVDMVEKLTQRIEEDSKQYAMSSIGLKRLSETIYHIAREVEIYGILKFKVEELFTALDYLRADLIKKGITK